MKLSQALAALFVITLVSPARATIHRVPSEYPTIQAAIDEAGDGDTVLIAEGRYYENIGFEGKAIVVGSQFILDGNRNHIPLTIIDGSRPSHPDSASTVMFMNGEDTTSVLCGVTVTGGSGTIYKADEYDVVVRGGGGIAVVSAGAKLCDNIIEGNSCLFDAGAAIGGGIAAGTVWDTGWVIIERNIIRDNSCACGGWGRGGAICALENCRIQENLIEDDSVVSDTGHPFGGGISVGHARVRPSITLVVGNTIRSCSLESSAGGPQGGGVSVDLGAEGSRAILDGNTVQECRVVALSDTSLAVGGGMAVNVFSSTSSATLRGNIVTDNVAVSGFVAWAGGVRFLQDNQDVGLVEANWISGNVASGSETSLGGGLKLDCKIVGQGLRFVVQNNIIAENRAEEGGGIWTEAEVPIALIHNTVAGNQAPFRGGGLCAYYGRLVLVNSVVWDNESPNGENLYVGYQAHLITFSSTVGAYSGSGNLSVEPRFVGGSDYFLSDSSECIGLGSDSVFALGAWVQMPTTDYTGAERPSPTGSRPDLGATEHWREKPLQRSAIAVSPLSIDFGNVLPGTESDTLAVVIGNRSAESLSILGLELSLDAFRVSGTATLPLAIPPFGESSIGLMFHPATPGLAVADTLKIQSSDPIHPTAAIPLRGRGSAPIQTASPGVLYAVPGASERPALYVINTVTGQAGPVAVLSPGPPLEFHGFALCLTDTTLYGAFSQGDETIFFRISSLEGDIERVRSISLGAMTSMAFDATGALFITTADGVLVRMEDLHASPEILGNTGHALTGLSFSPATGSLWGCAGDSLFTVDQTSARATLVGVSGWAEVRSSVVFSAAGALFGLLNGYLVAFDKVSGMPISIGETGHTEQLLLAMWGDAPTDIISSPVTLPSHWALYQNYPNPFNPTTVIEYDVPSATNVVLTIHDVNGREVASLVDRWLAPGRYTYKFTPLALASGVYFYSLRTGDFQATRKLLYLR